MHKFLQLIAEFEQLTASHTHEYLQGTHVTLDIQGIQRHAYEIQLHLHKVPSILYVSETAVPSLKQNLVFT